MEDEWNSLSVKEMYKSDFFANLLKYLKCIVRRNFRKTFGQPKLWGLCAFHATPLKEGCGGRGECAEEVYQKWGLFSMRRGWKNLDRFLWKVIG